MWALLYLLAAFLVYPTVIIAAIIIVIFLRRGIKAQERMADSMERIEDSMERIEEIIRRDQAKL